MTRNRSTPPRHILLTATLAVIASVLPCLSLAFDAERDDIKVFIDELAQKHGFDRDYVRTTLTQSESKQKILDAISRPAERALAWHEYRKIFITKKRIDAGIAFMDEQADRLTRISGQTGVPAEIIAAIIGVETYYGRITGNYRVVDALATLGFDYPPRAKFFRGQLKELFLLARDEKLELVDLHGSYAGAMGPPQFIPSSYRAYAVDGDGDGRRDLLSNWDDILMSVANYFIENGWRSGEPVAAPGKSSRDSGTPLGKNSLKITETLASLKQQGMTFDADLDADTPALLISLEGESGAEYWAGFHNFYVITRYNRSAMYALAVFQLSEALSANQGPDVAGQPADSEKHRDSS